MEGARRTVECTMGRWLMLVLVVLSLAACGGTPVSSPDAVATQVAVSRAAAATLTAEAPPVEADSVATQVAATLTAEAPTAVANLVATQVAAAKAAAATLTAEAPAPATPVPSSPAPTSPPAPSAEATAAPRPSATPQRLQDLSPDLALMAQEIREDNQAGFSYFAWAPLLVGSPPQVAGTFNRAVDGFLNYAFDDFRQGIADLTSEPGSSIWITHTVTAATEDLLSVLFFVDGYVMGAAHPFHYSHTLNYDLGGARVLGLSELFTPGTDYLEMLASYSLEDLERQGALLWEEGALPLPENYQSWNITPVGLRISFDEYSVAPYAAGPQAVIVPYDVLADIIDPQGPLAPYLE
jgi:hypothetical protein